MRPQYSELEFECTEVVSIDIPAKNGIEVGNSVSNREKCVLKRGLVWDYVGRQNEIKKIKHCTSFEPFEIYCSNSFQCY